MNLNSLLEILKKINHNFSAFCIRESWLSENDDTYQIQLDVYKCIPQDKSCSSKVGLIIYLNDKFDHKIKNRLNDYKTWEGQIIQVKKGNVLSKHINIGNIYRPPKDLLENY